MRYLIIVLLLTVCYQAEAGEFWTDDSTANGLMITANTLLVADWAQTREIADNPHYYEDGLARSFIGSDPTTGEVNTYFVGALALYNTINYFLPTKYKKLYSGAIVGFELSVVHGNIQLGVGMEF